MVIERIDTKEVPTFDVYKQLRAEAGDNLWPIATLAEYFGINIRTLRAQAKSGHIPMPSLRARSGGLSLQLYTHPECLEVQDYYQSTGRDLLRTLNPDVVLGDQEW